ncbi:unnamed protein product [Umbelopsis vinacea]
MRYKLLIRVIILATRLITVARAHGQGKTVLSLDLGSDVQCNTLWTTFLECNLSLLHTSLVDHWKDGLRTTDIANNGDMYGLEIASFCLGILLTMVAISIKLSLPQEEIEALGHDEKS